MGVRSRLGAGDLNVLRICPGVGGSGLRFINYLMVQNLGSLEPAANTILTP